MNRKLCSNLLTVPFLCAPLVPGKDDWAHGANRLRLVSSHKCFQGHAWMGPFLLTSEQAIPRGHGTGIPYFQTSKYVTFE